MERLRERVDLARRALTRLGELTARDRLSAIERDALVQRFEFTFEAVWKTAQRYLAVVEGTEVGSPAATIRSCRDVGLLDDAEAEAALQALQDRNLTSHTYNEELAVAIARRVPAHFQVLSALLRRISDAGGAQ